MVYVLVMPGPSKLEKVVVPGSGPRGPLPKSKWCSLAGKIRKFLPVVSLENRDLGSGPRGPLPSPVLTVQALALQMKVFDHKIFQIPWQAQNFLII